MQDRIAKEYNTRRPIVDVKNPSSRSDYINSRDKFTKVEDRNGIENTLCSSRVRQK